VFSAVLLAGCAAPSAGTDSESAHRIDWGVFLPDDQAPSSDLRVVSQMAGSAPRYIMRFAGIDDNTPIPELNRIAESGAMPIVTLEPWRPGMGPNQPAYALWRIAAGEFDTQLDTWARNLAEWGKPVVVRFGHEMTSDHYPWSVGINGNTGTDFVNAWNHVRSRFDLRGAENVSFMWCPDAPYEGSSDMAAAFPGTDAVDILGLDGYNWGDGDGHGWREPEAIFGAGLDRLRSLDGEHPIIIGETSSVEGPQSGIDKARWIQRLFDFLSRQQRVSGLVWFQMVKERDWRLNSSTESQAAFHDALAERPPA
jgi:Glycosyl hydrolase family 26